MSECWGVAGLRLVAAGWRRGGERVRFSSKSPSGAGWAGGWVGERPLSVTAPRRRAGACAGPSRLAAGDRRRAASAGSPAPLPGGAGGTAALSAVPSSPGAGLGRRPPLQQ